MTAGRRRTVALLSGWAVLALGAAAIGRRPAAAAPPPPTVRYDLDAALDAEAHVVHGRGTLAWRSDAKVPVDTLRFHLYLNAFRDEKTTFLHGPEGARHRSSSYDPEHPGSIEIERLALADGTDLRKAQRFVSCDDQNPDDRTVLEVDLPRPVAPGEEVVVAVEWTARLPRVFARTGFADDFHMVAQWFPKLGVFEDEGEGGATVAGWNCHQFHRTSEFFADYGTYDVRLRVPASYRGRVGATGERRSETTNDDGTVTYAFHAEGVHDFAWVCGERFDVHVARFRGGDGGWPREAERVARALGRTVSDVALPPVRVTFLLMPEHSAQRERHERAVFSALALMGLWYGPYPYPELTVVDPDHRAAGAGGMEYPTLITGGTDYVVADRGLTPEFVLVHEFGHQHFYGLLASNEAEDAWMDEGMTTYATARVLAAAYPPRVEVSWVAGRPWYREPPLDFPGLWAALGPQLPVIGSARMPWGRLGHVRGAARRLGAESPDDVPVWPAFGEPSPVRFLREAAPLTHVDVEPRSIAEHERRRYAEAPDVDDLAGRHSWEYLDGRSYSTNSYRRAAAMLRTLEGLLGEDRMTVLMRTYAERHRFRHPTPDDFFAVAQEVAREDGHDLRPFFDELVRGTGTIDFAVHDVTSADPAPDGTVESTVTLRRLGTARFPVTVRVAFEDRTVRRLRWGLDDRVVAIDRGDDPVPLVPPAGRQYRWARVRLRHTAPVAWAETDPDRVVALELDRGNDGRRREPDARATNRISVRALGWLEMNASFYGGL